MASWAATDGSEASASCLGLEASGVGVRSIPNTGSPISVPKASERP